MSSTVTASKTKENQRAGCLGFAAKDQPSTISLNRTGGLRHGRNFLDWSEARERALLLDALAALRRSNLDDPSDIDALTIKLVHSAPHPDITVGVHGGQVQWTLGNPFPIRVCDYDGASDEDLPDIDQRGQRCRMWWEPADAA